ncbi:MAG: carbon-nitrogen hydrolase family protein [Myxococcota bacterium]|nr:carbon-nitrogen hydrolase family protein [Myxococcota bacterium]
MKVTVCQLSNHPAHLEREWKQLASHVSEEKSSLVLLPEMPFYPWLSADRSVDPGAWRASVAIHDLWMARLQELSAPVVIGTRPVVSEDKRLNMGFVWQVDSGHVDAHAKVYLPNEAGFWEATWYQRGEKHFDTFFCQSAAVGEPDIGIGFLICTEMWFSEHARDYGRQGANILACPRATAALTVDKWIAAGRVAAVRSGAFCLSSNFSDDGTQALPWAGTGWIIHPEEGDVIGLTSNERPFLTVDIDLNDTTAAKQTYPRYVEK